MNIDRVGSVSMSIFAKPLPVLPSVGSRCAEEVHLEVNDGRLGRVRRKQRQRSQQGQ